MPEDEAGALPAGDFADWLAGMRDALRGEGGSEVPCDGCTACCRSSQFVHIGPDEEETLARIPPELLFPAPRLPAGNMVLGYDGNGRCPMLIDDRCSIYEHRPRTCRTYDCRVLPASGVEVDDEAQLPVASRAGRWRFSFPTEADRGLHDAVRAAAAYVRDHRDVLPEGAAPANPTQHAVLAVRLHAAFLAHDGDPDPEAVRAALTSRRQTGARAPSSSSRREDGASGWTPLRAAARAAITRSPTTAPPT